MYFYILQYGIAVMVEENAGSGTVPGTHGHHSAGDEAAVFPVWGGEDAVFGGGHLFGGEEQVAGVVNDVAVLFFKGDARRRTGIPSFSVGFKNGVFGDAPLYPRGRFKGYPFLRIILYYADLADVGIGKVNAEIAQGAVF
ncbi:conserved domain protein [Bacteroides fluxus YIT 12057]|uniref:Conserved domain protein n=1 Tax=Bacteroides fluxus YIT 12057 TaxID=763034 RepID=F3PSV8_9BACE|nr:conserved domain protein [Bacteroides fluxus YIT 12057]